MSESSTPEPPAHSDDRTPHGDHRVLMDRIYRSQRHVYDMTRRYYLLGRDTLIERMDLQPGDRVLEIGCGTARNIIHLARRYPSVKFYGIDASREMLKTACANVDAAGLSEQARLECCLAEELSPRNLFGITEPFDAVFFSYALSMIPPWRAAVDQGLANLKTGKHMWVVDFWDQDDLPRWFARILKKWLSLFHVSHKPELIEYFRELEGSGTVELSIESLYRRYAYLAKLTKVAS